jgi:hypothetical protein
MNKLDAWLSKILDGISDYVSAHRGVPVLLGVALVVLNYILLIIPGVQLGFVETTNLFLHVGVIVGPVVLLGMRLAESQSSSCRIHRHHEMQMRLLRSTLAESPKRKGRSVASEHTAPAVGRHVVSRTRLRAQSGGKRRWVQVFCPSPVVPGAVRGDALGGLRHHRWREGEGRDLSDWRR